MTRLDQRRTASTMLLIGAVLLDPFSSRLQAQQPADRLSAMDVFQLEFAATPQISPDGGRIVYVRQRADIMADARYSNLWLLNADGTGHRALTTGNFSDASPSWSPDGTRILFVSNRENASQVWVYWLESGQMTRVTNAARTPNDPVWSPDGRYIAFTSLVPGQAHRLVDLPAPPHGAEWAPPARVLDRLVYQFNGVGELEPGWSQLFVAPAEGGAARQISAGEYHHGGGAGRGPGFPVWTPDGKYILISANRRPDFEIESRDTEIYEFDVATSAMRALTDRRGPDNNPAVSPDGRRVAFTGFDDRHQGHQVTRLYLMNRDGGGIREITPQLDRDVANPRWAADGSGVFFQFDDQGTTRIGFVSANGGDVRRLASNVGGGASAYSGGSYSVASNGRISFTHSTPSLPSNVAVAGGRDSTRVITRLNEQLLAQKRPGDVEEIWYASSKDGRRVHGWIIKPPGFDASLKYPLILEIHGGPFANYGDRFDIEKQVWAAAGYVVLYTNPRGSTSYGEEFGNLIHYAYPGDDFHDLDSGVDAVIAKGYIDSDNVFVTGGSGGGVLTAWMIGRTNRFRAAVAQYPVINWYSFALTSDIPSTVNRYWFPGPPWEHLEEYHQRSLTSLVGNVRTPTMIITGEEDYRTPMSESEQYYQALKIAGIEAVLVKVPGEPHGITRRPSHHMQKIAYIQAWFDRHRGPPRTDGDR